MTVWYGPKQERLFQYGLEAAEVANNVEKIRGRLGCGLATEKFHQKLQEAYARATGGVVGKPAPIVEVLRELAYLLQDSQFLQDPRQENYKGYDRADFSYDLYLLRQSASDILVDKRPHLVVAT